MCSARAGAARALVARGAARGTAAGLLGARDVDRERRRDAAAAGPVDGGDVVAARALRRRVARALVERGGAHWRVAWTIAARGPVRDADLVARRLPDRLSPRRRAGGRRRRRHGGARLGPACAAGGAGVAPRRAAHAGLGGRERPGRGPRRRHRRAVWRSAATLGAARALAWSADGHRLLARGGRRLTVLDVTGNRAWRVRLPAGASVSAAAWAPPGRSDGPGGPHAGGHEPSWSRRRRACRGGRSSPPPARCARWPGRPTAGACSCAAPRPISGFCSPRHRQRSDHRHRRHLAALRQRAHRAGLVLLLS